MSWYLEAPRYSAGCCMPSMLRPDSVQVSQAREWRACGVVSGAHPEQLSSAELLALAGPPQRHWYCRDCDDPGLPACKHSSCSTVTSSSSSAHRQWLTCVRLHSSTNSVPWDGCASCQPTSLVVRVEDCCSILVKQTESQAKSSGTIHMMLRQATCHPTSS